MQITNLKIRPTGYPNIKLTWDYNADYVDNSNNYLVKIGFSENDLGPFQPLVELPFNTVEYIFKQSNTKYLEFVFFELSIYNTFTKKIEHIITAGVDKPESLYVDKLESKYRLLLKKRIGNEVLFFKRKKAGYHCRECWDPVNARVLKDECETCFETGYGNNSVVGLESLHLDGILKTNTEGYLEFYKKDYTFNFYKLGEDAIETESPAGIKTGDIFQIKNTAEEIIYSKPIIEPTHNGFIINEKSGIQFENLENLKFNVFKYEDTSIDNLKIDFKIIRLTETTAKVFFINNFDKATTLKINNTLFTITERVSDSFIITGNDLDLFKTYNNFLILNDDLVLENIVPDAIFYIDSTLTGILNLKAPLNLPTDSHFLITYYYDGQTRFKINGFQKILGENTTPGKTPSLWSLKNSSANTYELKLETLSNYENLFKTPEILFTTVFEHYFLSNLYLNIKTLNIRKALQQIEVYLKPNTTFFLPHTNILKDYFRGCGVLAINLLTGKTYRGQLWVDGWQTADTEYDFYVNPETGEFNTMQLPQATYEIKYVYAVENIKFNTVFNYSKDGCSFVSSKLKGIDLPNKMILSGGLNKNYKVYEIEKQHLNGKLLLKSTTQDLDFFNSISPSTKFSIDYPASGGYYTAEKSYINYMTDTPRLDIPTDIGVMHIEKKSAIITMDIQLNTGDLVYDVLAAKFYSVSDISENSFKGRGTFQKLDLTLLPFNKQTLLTKLLER